MGFNRRKLEDQRRTAAEKEAPARRATDAQALEDAERRSGGLLTNYHRERTRSELRCKGYTLTDEWLPKHRQDYHRAENSSGSNFIKLSVGMSRMS
jgi:hypothetical protein